MNIKFFTIFLSLLLIANPSFAEGNEETTDFGLDEPVVDTAEEVIETVDKYNVSLIVTGITNILH